MNAQADEPPPSGVPPHDPDRDVLAERRARRGEPVGDPILIRRAETAEAAAQELEDRLSGIQARLQEAERESQAASQRLAEREQELLRASQRLTDGEQQLRSISERLGEREQELRSVSERLEDRERELRSVSARLGERELELREVSQLLGERERELHRAELEIRSRVEALERRVGEVQTELGRERLAREAAERELAALRGAQAAVQPLVAELRQIAHRLRVEAVAGVEAVADVQAVPDVQAGAGVESAGRVESATAIESAAGVPPETTSAPETVPEARVAEVEPAIEAAESVEAEAQPAQPASALGKPLAPAKARPEPTGAQMAEALAAAIQRLRARVAAVTEPWQERAEEAHGESAEQEVEQELAEAGAPYIPPPAEERDEPRPWLAPAIRRVAEHRDPRLAAELVLELLPAQALVIEGALRYVAKIAELGSYEVSLAAGRSSVSELRDAPSSSPEFVLEGAAASFAELAAGGSRLSIWRPPSGLRIKRGRRRARRLLRSRLAPLSLRDLERAGMTVWPGLLLLALAEAIDPASTAGYAFTIAFEIEGKQSAVLQVRAQNGRPLAVMRGAPPAAPGGPLAGGSTASAASTGSAGSTGSNGPFAGSNMRPETIVRLSEQAFARMLTGEDLAGEKVLLEGEREPLDTLLSWTDRVQGIRRFAA